MVAIVTQRATFEISVCLGYDTYLSELEILQATIMETQ